MASDGTASADDTFTLTVDNVNDSPVVSTAIADQSTDEDGAYSYDASAAFSDADLGDTLTYSATLADGSALPAWLTIDANTGVLSGTPDNGDVGSYSVNVVASDGTASADDTFTLTVEPAPEQITTTTTTVSVTTSVIDSDANDAAGIYERDGNYYQLQETGAVDVAALRDKGYTMDSDGNFFVIDDDAPKTLITQEVEKEVTRIVDAEPIMKTATEETTFMTVGDEHVDQGTTVGTKDSVRFDFAEPTSNVELLFSDFNTGTSKVSFYDENGDQVGRDINVSQTNGAVGFTVPEGAVGIEVYNGDRSNTFDIDTISYRGEAHEVTVQAGGLVPDYDAMAAAGISWTETESETIVQTADITDIGDVGNNRVDGFNPEDHELSQVFDFGPDLANRMVSITVDMTVSGSWDNNATSTNDYFSLSANGQEIDVNYYSNRSSGWESDDVNYLGRDNTESYTNTYDVYLDDDGQVQLDFMVASTATDEVVNVSNIEVAYEGQTGWVKEETGTITVEESVLVDAPAQQVDAEDIPGGVPMETEEVQVAPILREVTSDETITRIDGTSGSDVLMTSDADEVIDLADGADVLNAAGGDDTIIFDAADTVDAGLGLDTLVMNESVTIDFGTIGDQLANFETIDLNEGNQNITLSTEDVLDMTQSGDHRLQITGDEDDTVQLNTTGDDAEWTRTGSVTGDDGNTYDVYEGTSGGENVTLEVDQNITVTDF